MNRQQPALGDDRGPWIQLRSGRPFYLLTPEPDDIDVEDIAHALANLARWNGQTREFYSVAQHSIHVAALSPTEGALWGLLHDAAEAYVGDMVAPLKLAIPAFQRVEDGILKAIAVRFGLAWPMPPAVRGADRMALATEARDLLNGGAIGWDPGPSDVMREIVPMAPGEAESHWLYRFGALGGKP